MKRVFDLALVLGSALMWVPVALALGVLVRARLGRPVVFRQMRPGLGGAPFEILKFRTMRDAAHSTANPLPDAKRLTPFGRFLRATSLDELPELWNVIRGDMSLVGPRPLLMDYLALYSPEQSRRHEVRPGITGWSQINGRNRISWEERFALDVWYVDNRTMWLDLKICFVTILRVFKREGITEEGEATMSRFIGSNRPEDSID